MESKLNFNAIETYAEAYSAKLMDEIFSTKETVSGEELLSLPVKQVGLLILDNIYQSWASEAEKLKSSYFNYDAAEVKEGMRKLMNILSKNILVSKDDFKPLLAGAVKDTLLLALSPYSFYSNLLRQEGISYELLKEKRKFIKINESVIKLIIEDLTTSQNLINDPETLLNKVFGSTDDTPQNNKDILDTFADLCPLDEAGFYHIDEEQPAVQKPEIADEDDDDESDSTLNASFMGNTYETVADKLKNTQPAGSLKSMLSINLKFMFINDLFDGNQDDFTKVLDFLEDCRSKSEAVSFIQSNYLKHNVWKENSPQVKEFMALLDKKFD